MRLITRRVLSNSPLDRTADADAAAAADAAVAADADDAAAAASAMMTMTSATSTEWATMIGDDLPTVASPSGGPLRDSLTSTGDMPAPGRAVHVDPIKPTLEALGTKRLKLKRDEPPSNLASKFNLRLYTRVRSGCFWRKTRRRTKWPSAGFSRLRQEGH